MANLSNINNKFLVTTGGNVLIGATAAVGSSILQITGASSPLAIHTPSGNNGLEFIIDNGLYKNWQIGVQNQVGNALTIVPSTAAGNTTFSTPVATFLTSGNIGIGTTTPDVKLDIEGTGGEILRLRDTDGSYTALTLYNDATSTDSRNWGIFNNGYNYGDFNIVSSTTNTGNPDITNATRLTITKDGNVGIGTTSPGEKLEVDGNAELKGNLIINKFSSTAPYADGEIRFTGRYDRYVGGIKTFTDNASYPEYANGLDFFVQRHVYALPNGHLAMRIDSDGNVGIGTSTPVSQANYTTLCVNGTNSALIEAQVGTVRIGGIDSSSTALYFGSIGTYPVIFRVAVSEKMRINSQGQTWIGGSSYTGSDIANGNTSYLNSLNAGAFSILHRNSSDAYIHFNSYYTSSGTYLSKYTGIGFMVGVNAATDNGMFISKAPSVSAGAVQTFENGIMQIGYGANNHVGIGTTGPDSKIQVEARNASNVIYAGLRVGYNATSNNYYDADTHHFRLGTGSSAGGNLYVGGGVYLGGTAAANQLDDYEEGTWTPTISHNDGTGAIPLSVSGSAYYVKVGRLVHVFAYLVNVNPNGNAGGSGPYYAIKGLPFSAISHSTWSVAYANNNMTSYGGYAGGDNLYFMKLGTNGQCSNNHVNGTFFNTWGQFNFMFQAVYQAN